MVIGTESIEMEEPLRYSYGRKGEEGEEIRWHSRREASASVFALRNLWACMDCQCYREEVTSELHPWMQWDFGTQG